MGKKKKRKGRLIIVCSNAVTIESCKNLPNIWSCNANFLRLGCFRFGILKSQICMVGDRLDTDILFSQNGG